MYHAAFCFCLLMLYSFLGWVYESALCSITQRKWVNRGFLNGPLCPIYGFGAMLVVGVFGGKGGNLFALFLASAVLTCTLEYVTSYVMEKLFHARWWDYSNRKFQLNGRICLEGFLVFGLLSVIIVKWVHPFFTRWLNGFEPWVILTAGGVLLLLFFTDLLLTVRHVLLLGGRLREIQAAIDTFRAQSGERKAAFREHWREKFESSPFHSPRIQKLLETRKFQDRRLSRAFPSLKPVWHEAWEQLKEKLENRKG